MHILNLILKYNEAINNIIIHANICIKNKKKVHSVRMSLLIEKRKFAINEEN